MFAFAALLLSAVAPGQDVPVAVLQQSVARGEPIEVRDLAVEDRPAATARGALQIDELVGMEATRNLTAGNVIRRSDVTRAQLVRRGEPVTVRIASGAMVISASGRALGGGAAGDTVRVLVTATSRTLDGVVDGTGSVRITTP
ncbi:flagellar basal body P-ring formation chaperone FlgA [Sphingomonas sp. RS6]